MEDYIKETKREEDFLNLLKEISFSDQY